MAEETRTVPEKTKLIVTNNKPVVTYVAIALLVIIAGVGGFVGGILFQSAQASNGQNNGPGGNGQAQGGFGNRQMGGFGTVNAVSGTSLTISQQQFGGPNSSSSSSNTTSVTYTLTSGTTVTDSGTTKAVSDIAIGDTVRVTTSQSSTTTATAIELNPTMGMGGPGTTQSSQTN